MSNEVGGSTDVPPWFPKLPGVEQIDTVPVMRLGMSPILVAGDSVRNKVQCMPGGGYATVEIELPDNWDALLAERGYRSLAEFALREGQA